MPSKYYNHIKTPRSLKSKN